MEELGSSGNTFRDSLASDTHKEDVMPIHKVIEVISQSENSWEDAAQRAVTDAGRTVEQIKSIWIKNFEAVVKDNKIVEYRVNANITFGVK